MPVTRSDLEDLIEQVRKTPGWDVADHPSRWRITNSAGGGPLFVNHRPPKGNTLKGIENELLKRGWDATAAEHVVSVSREERLRLDRERNQREMDAATRRMRDAELTALRETIAEKDDELLKVRAGLAYDLGEGVTKEVLDMDADLATELLAYNHFFDKRGEMDMGTFTNRPIDMALVFVYRDAMVRGEWTRSHQGLGFDKDMRLVDGQHRLLAVIEANKIKPGVTFRTEVTYNLDPEVFKVVDTGKKRTTSDILALRNIPHRLAAAATVKLLHLFYDLPFSQWNKVRLTNPQTLEMYERFNTLEGHEGLLKTAVRVGANLTSIITTPSAGAAGYYISSLTYPAADVDEFAFGLKSGESLDPGDPRLAYRRFNEKLRLKKRATTNNIEQLALWIKAWNAWVDGTPVHQLVWRSNETFPQPIIQAKASTRPEVKVDAASASA